MSSFFFPFPENKEDKESSEQARTFLVISLLTACNSACLNCLLFCPLIQQELYFAPIFLDSMLNKPVSGIYPYNAPPLVVMYQKEGCKATQLPDSITGSLMPAYDCL